MKPEWGKKVACIECGSIFYDMNRIDVVCVKCGHKFKPAIIKKATKSDKKIKKSPLPDSESIDVTDYYNLDDDLGSVMDKDFVMEEV